MGALTRANNLLACRRSEKLELTCTQYIAGLVLLKNRGAIAPRVIEIKTTVKEINSISTHCLKNPNNKYVG
jgi:hypothetical protein